MADPSPPSRRWLSPAQRDEAARRYAAGKLATEIAAELGCHQSTVSRAHQRWRMRRRRGAGSGYRLSFAERERISRGLAAEESLREIARALGRAPSTISRKVRCHGGRRASRAARAHRRAERRLARPKRGKLARCPRLRAEVEAGLRRRWSPQQISAKLSLRYPTDPEMQVSHETIYRSLYIQSRGELRRQLAANLRSGRCARRARSSLGRRGKIKGMVPISERPAEVEDRAVPGRWEGDLLVGNGARSFIATLVERQTRYVMLARLGRDGSTEHVIAALKERIRDLSGTRCCL